MLQYFASFQVTEDEFVGGVLFFFFILANVKMCSRYLGLVSSVKQKSFGHSSKRAQQEIEFRRELAKVRRLRFLRAMLKDVRDVSRSEMKACLDFEANLQQPPTIIT